MNDILAVRVAKWARAHEGRLLEALAARYAQDPLHHAEWGLPLRELTTLMAEWDRIGARETVPAGSPSHIVLAGNPLDGLTPYGPFDSCEAAETWAERERIDRGDWWIVALRSPGGGQ